jgi:hypothetical protein
MIHGVAWEPVEHGLPKLPRAGVLVNGSSRMWIADICTLITSIFTRHAARVAILCVISRRHEAQLLHRIISHRTPTGLGANASVTGRDCKCISS